MSSNNDNLEVYVYRGNKGEEVPFTVEKLIVEEGVQELPDDLCDSHLFLGEVSLPGGLREIGNGAFCNCVRLLEFRISSTVQFISSRAFFNCYRVTKVTFEASVPSPHQLQGIEEEAFGHCSALSRIKLPSSVYIVGQSVFYRCSQLTEADLSATGVTEIDDSTFLECRSLQIVSLPITLKRIGKHAFHGCSELVTVVVPIDSESITIGRWSFGNCSRLANIPLPTDSTATDSSFRGCELLRQRYGDDSSSIVAGLIGRFGNCLIHKMFHYNHLVIPVQDLRQCLLTDKEISLEDEFGMTLFHLLFLTIEPKREVLEVLFEALPSQLLKCKDANGMRPLEYLINNWNDGTPSLVQRVFQKGIIDPVSRWGVPSWVESIQAKVQELLVEDDKGYRKRLCDEAYSALEHYENIQATSILEMALWKGQLKSGWTSDGTKRHALDREECRCLSGASVVIPQVTIFLNLTPAAPEAEDSLEDDSSQANNNQFVEV